MMFVYQKYLAAILVLSILFIYLIHREESKFYKYIERFWFLKRSIVSYFASFCFLAGLFLLSLSLLDLRGQEERVKAQVPSKRTIILIDTSASMLAEDVRPSRQEKAVLLAKHFARKAVGHQISVIAFSEIQKKIVPFTADIDLIDARLESIRGLKNQYGSSALSLAIQESVQYFKDAGGDPVGNILVLTDGEEQSEGIKLDIPKGVYVALVGIGTKNGGRIPLDDKRGLRYGYKSFKGKDVITKLNESFFSNLVAANEQSKYWLADTYALPSEEIVSFFNSEFEKGMESQDMVIRPVLMHWLVIPAVVLLIIGYGLKMIKVFVMLAMFVISPVTIADEEEKKMPAHIQESIERLQDGRLSRNDKLGLAYELQANQFTDEAVQIYKEENRYLNEDQRFNFGTALLANKDYTQGFSEYQKLLNQSNVSDDLKKKIIQNSLQFLKQQEQDKQKKDQKDKNKEQDKDKGQKGENGESGNDSSQNQNQGNNESDDKSNESDSKDEKKDESKGENDPEDKKDESNGEKDQDEKEENKQDSKETESRPPQQDTPKKIPAKLKQLMSDDRKLQMDMIERGTKDMNKRKTNTRKDW